MITKPFALSMSKCECGSTNSLKKQLFCILKINTLRVLKNTKNYVKQRLFLVNALIREAGLTLLTMNGIILLCVSSTRD
jgi:hypothetical protein